MEIDGRVTRRWADEGTDTPLEALRPTFGHLTANGKLWFAVYGFTLPVFSYLGLKICRW